MFFLSTDLQVWGGILGSGGVPFLLGSLEGLSVLPVFSLLTACIFLFTLGQTLFPYK